MRHPHCKCSFFTLNDLWDVTYFLVSPLQFITRMQINFCLSYVWKWLFSMTDSTLGRCSTKNFIDKFQYLSGWGCEWMFLRCLKESGWTIGFACTLIWPAAAVSLLTLGHPPLVIRLPSRRLAPAAVELWGDTHPSPAGAWYELSAQAAASKTHTPWLTRRKKHKHFFSPPFYACQITYPKSTSCNITHLPTVSPSDYFLTLNCTKSNHCTGCGVKWEAADTR